MTASQQERYYTDAAAAFVRGNIDPVPELSAADLVAWGAAQGIRLHHFKRAADLPRIRKVFGPASCGITCRR